MTDLYELFSYRNGKKSLESPAGVRNDLPQRESLEREYRNMEQSLRSASNVIEADFSRREDESPAIGRVRTYIESHYWERVTLDDLSKEFQMSKFRIFRLFRQKYGLTPFAYVTRLRLQRAAEMLLDGDSIAQVAWDVGFVDQSHLTRHFKKYFGVTPLKFCAVQRAS